MASFPRQLALRIPHFCLPSLELQEVPPNPPGIYIIYMDVGDPNSDPHTFPTMAAPFPNQVVLSCVRMLTKQEAE